MRTTTASVAKRAKKSAELDSKTAELLEHAKLRKQFRRKLEPVQQRTVFRRNSASPVNELSKHTAFRVKDNEDVHLLYKIGGSYTERTVPMTDLKFDLSASASIVVNRKTANGMIHSIISLLRPDGTPKYITITNNGGMRIRVIFRKQVRFNSAVINATNWKTEFAAAVTRLMQLLELESTTMHFRLNNDEVMARFFDAYAHKIPGTKEYKLCNPSTSHGI